MSINILFFFTGILLLFSNLEVNAQQTARTDKLYTVSGIGTSIPIGESSDFLGPKISTTFGLNLGLGKGGLFLYPKVSLHAFTYNGIRPDHGYNYTAQNSRVTTYLLNMALGYRKMVGKFAFYGFAGGGGGFILTPRVKTNNTALEVEFSNQTNGMAMLEAGLGAELNLGGLSIFTEVSYMNGFNNIQDRKFSSMPLTIGIKPNLSKLIK
ncbi:autotransporter outer membrane beta-barrel domain-containing protein [Pedobacter sp. ASV28]|uniref:autotransporter outer membrane beta-barrel domain-containing protein n=1 Tax=Pedobacter sp. ASV28 TaxID=2795123 RepID=UPI0018ECD768|nr:autotransporter outer membrane beta-barrel domain-containing protein [Pedobacter sp. ASV28]